ncbi:type II secretion system major pseudopilin GspG [Sulfitobacter albidus]|uniref:Type II secretion system core protein G n=1 Tax=Sulfitobacter albidus TaxID=2829501 RepID=A0A975JEC2_9RHOB|nr:type II secretion system major pseudopilin GspG [Sulfitobacter albidus]QUJ76782.1 type II secretion system major pseudopilin GspG [Sulfitobacter albidus]
MTVKNSENRKHPARRDPEAGVTLIEMMVVLVIIAVVAAMVVPNVIGRPDEARVTVARTDLRTIAGALEIYRLDNRTYPSTAQGLAALVQRPTVPPEPVNWASGGYLSVMPQDPWGAPYVYQSPGQTGPFDLTTLGADGQPGGEGVNADITHGTVQANNG